MRSPQAMSTAPRGVRAGAAVLIAVLLAAAGSHPSLVHAQSKPSHVTLLPGGGAPGASGSATIGIVGSAAVGSVEARNLPAQAFGSGRFYGVWYVRSDNSKAFLGALVQRNSIILSTGGNGVMTFSATKFTDGPAVGAPISFGPAGTNTIIVLIENLINGLTPAPVGPVPGTGVAVVGTF